MTCDEIQTAIDYYSALLGSLNAQISTLASQIDGAATVVKSQDTIAGGPAVTDFYSADQINARIAYLGTQMMVGGSIVYAIMAIMSGYQAILTMINQKASLEQQKVYPQQQLNELVLLKQAQCP